MIHSYYNDVYIIISVAYLLPERLTSIWFDRKAISLVNNISHVTNSHFARNILLSLYVYGGTRYVWRKAFVAINLRQNS